MKFKKVFILLFLIFISFFGFNTYVLADDIKFDYSRSESLDTVIMSATELIEYITNDEVCDAEKEYLKNYIDTFKYENKIPSNKVMTSINNDELFIRAESHSYVDINNNTITWIPYIASIDNNSCEFVLVDDCYEAKLQSVSEDVEAVKIEYKTIYSLEKEKINVLLNDAYNIADYYVSNNIVEIQKELYEQEYNQYLQDLESYEKYLEDLDKYNNDTVLYKQYQNDYKVYLDKLEKYELYLEDYEEYEKQKVEYQNYLTAIDQYNIDYAAYQNYINNILPQYELDYANYLVELENYNEDGKYIEYGLKAMELITTRMTSLERNLYDAIMGSAVTQVLERSEELYEVGVDKAPILKAETATYKLKEIIPAYFSLQTDREKYAYYKANYNAIRNNFNDLLIALEELYTDYSLVRGAIDTMFGKKQEYLILIAQLVLFCNVINQKEISSYDKDYYFDSKWKIEGKTMDQVLEYDYTFVDDPKLSFPYPKEYIEKPVEPTITHLTEPTKPEEVSEPVAPTVVEQPTEPTKVEEPVKPEEVSEPSEPVEYVLDELTQSLIDAYKNNDLVKRNEYDSDLQLSFVTSFNKKFRNATEVTVEFYDLDNNLITSYTTDSGSYISYDATLPTKPEDNVYKTYKFSHWVYEDGEVLDLNNVTREGFVYPRFVGAELQKYTVTWIVDGNTYEEQYEYGSTPIFKEDLDKQYNGDYYYEFDSWDKQLSSVIEDVTYQASFKQYYLISNDDKFANITYDESLVVIDCINLDTNCIDVYKFFDEVVTEDSSFKLQFVGANWSFILSNLSVYQLLSSNLKTINVKNEAINELEYEFDIQFINEKNEVITGEHEINITFNGSFDSVKSSVYVLDEQGNETLVRCNITKDSVTLSNFKNNKKYVLYPLYKITSYSNEYVEILVDRSNSKYNQLVTLTITMLVEGIFIDNIILLDSKNNPITLNDDNTFIMPCADVMIASSYSFYNYRIEFIVDGEVVSSKVYKYGDEVILPPNPMKASDEQYSYKFIGWDSEVTSVDSNKTYTSVFETEEVFVPEIPKKPSIIRKVKNVFWVVLGVGSVSAFFIITKKKHLVFFKEKNIIKQEDVIKKDDEEKMKE